MAGKVNLKEIYLYLLIISAFVSISIFEVFVVIGILWLFYDFSRERKLSGGLKLPVLTFSFTTVISTALSFPKMISKAVEEGLFQILYFLKINSNRESIKRIIFTFLTIAVLLIPLVIYNYITLGRTKPIWGGEFEVGQFYGMFTLIAFFVGLYFFKDKNKKIASILFILSLIFFAILIMSTKRSPILGFLFISYLTFLVMYKNRLVNRITFWGLNLFLFIAVMSGYAYLSKTDPRFQTLNQVVTGKKPLNFQTLNKISSARVGIGIDGINVIKTDIKEGRVVNLLIGHGVRSAIYLPKEHSPAKLQKYESVFLISEFIEKGLLGLIAILAIFYLAFKTFLTVKITDSFDILALGLFVPLLIHLIGSIFTFFWDALLPMYLLLFKIGEVYFRSKSET
ncbi:O-antigen ligase family protein [Persephonella sp.]